MTRVSLLSRLPGLERLALGRFDPVVRRYFLGVALSALGSGLTLPFLFVYLSIIGREVGTARPEDEPDGEIAHGAGTLGFFPPKSIWPLWCALAITVVFLGPVFGWWISMLGFGMGIWAASGMVFEFYKGDYAH